MGSPLPGGSTLMISAPMSPSSWPQKGPAISWPISTTRSPASGPAGATVSLTGSLGRQSMHRAADPAPDRLARRRQAGLRLAGCAPGLDIRTAIEERQFTPLRADLFTKGLGRGEVHLAVGVGYDAICLG